MSVFEPSFLLGVAVALATSVVAGVIVLWFSERWRGSSKLTWEFLGRSSLRNEFPLFARYEEDGKALPLEPGEYRRRLNEIDQCSHVHAIRISNQGTKPAEGIHILLDNMPYFVDAYEKIGIELTSYKDGVSQIAVRSLSADSSVTIMFFAEATYPHEIQVEHLGEPVPQERAIKYIRLVRNARYRDAFGAVVALLAILIVILSQGLPQGEDEPLRDQQVTPNAPE